MATKAITMDGIAAEDSNQASVKEEMKAGDGSVSEVEDQKEENSFSQCSFCNMECTGENKSQHWIGELGNPKYIDKYPLPTEFIIGTGENRTINLQKILENLPDVIEYIREPSTPYKELEGLLNEAEIGENSHPYIKEIKMHPFFDENIKSSIIKFIDCEYMLKVSIPKLSTYSAFLKGEIFKPEDHKITNEHKERDKFRWIFIPPSERFVDVTLKRSHFKTEGEMSAGDTICFVVVKESQFNRYRQNFGDTLPIIQLPENEIGVGYARFWIVKIAKCFALECIWMIDDSVDSFKEYFPTERGNSCKKDPDTRYSKRNNRCQEYCFLKMETIMEKQPNLVAISPRRYEKDVNVLYEFSYKHLQSVMLLNITKLTENNLNFRPELQYMEDMVFIQECSSAGLEVCTCNAILFVENTKSALTQKKVTERQNTILEKVEHELELCDTIT